MDEEQLQGGNTHPAIARLGNTVRRPTGPWTPGIHALLRHLESRDFGGSPRVLGIDEEGREILSFVPGDVVYPDHMDLVTTDEGLTAVARLIRTFHDAVMDFDSSPRYLWSDRGSSGDPSEELICHNDLAPWNLVHTPDNKFVFIDWDLAAPGPRSWELSWSLLTFIPLMPSDESDDSTISRRLALFREVYGSAFLRPNVIDVAIARCKREAHLITTLGQRGEPPYDRLLADGHFDIWSRAADHLVRHRHHWKRALA
ncbi:MAG: phosphotransferase [Actinobacteria bacterium]|nr:phosphotransferase [Actinomycetota bacterium]